MPTTSVDTPSPPTTERPSSQASPRIPIEILQHIIHQCSSSARAKLMRISQLFYKLTGPILYRRIPLALDEKHTVFDGLPVGKHVQPLWTKKKPPVNRKRELLKFVEVVDVEKHWHGSGISDCGIDFTKLEYDFPKLETVHASSPRCRVDGICPALTQLATRPRTIVTDPRTFFGMLGSRSAPPLKNGGILILHGSGPTYPRSSLSRNYPDIERIELLPVPRFRSSFNQAPTGEVGPMEKASLLERYMQNFGLLCSAKCDIWLIGLNELVLTRQSGLDGSPAYYEYDEAEIKQSLEKMLDLYGAKVGMTAENIDARLASIRLISLDEYIEHHAHDDRIPAEMLLGWKKEVEEFKNNTDPAMKMVM